MMICQFAYSKDLAVCGCELRWPSVVSMKADEEKLLEEVAHERRDSRRLDPRTGTGWRECVAKIFTFPGTHDSVE